MPVGHSELANVGNHFLEKFVGSSSGCEAIVPDVAAPDRHRAGEADAVTFYRGLAIGLAMALPLWALLVWGVVTL